MKIHLEDCPVCKTERTVEKWNEMMPRSLDFPNNDFAPEKIGVVHAGVSGECIICKMPPGISEVSDQRLYNDDGTGPYCVNCSCLTYLEKKYGFKLMTRPTKWKVLKKNE